MSEILAQALPDELAAELTSLTPFANFDAAVAAINHGIRAKYLTRLYQLVAAGTLTDPIVHSVGAAINAQCDRVIASMAPIQDAANGWSGYPRSSLEIQQR